MRREGESATLRERMRVVESDEDRGGREKVRGGRGGEVCRCEVMVDGG